MAPHNPSIMVRAHSNSIPGPECFELCDLPLPKAPEGGVLVRLHYVSVDPAMRDWLSHEANYLTVPVGQVMRAHGVGEVVASNQPGYSAGDMICGFFGWSAYYAAQADDIWWKIDTAIAPAPVWLNLFGLNGLTAWIGLNHFGRPAVGETILVTTAAGAVGSAVGQLARAAGLRAVGIAGGAKKARLAEQHFGYDKVIDYRGTEDLDRAIAEACPNGIDLFYDNVGGGQADATFRHLRQNARIVQCGTVSVPSWTPWPQGPRRERDILVRRLSWSGFVVMDHVALYPSALESLTSLYRAGKLTSREDIWHGLERAPSAIAALYEGLNEGKLCIAV